MTTHATELYPFSHSEQQVTFYKLLNILRCSVCQNQNLRDSMAPVALDLRAAIYQQVLANHSEQQIIDFVTTRYGTAVLYEPPLIWQTSILWFGPLLMLIIVGVYLKQLLEQKKKNSDYP